MAGKEDPTGAGGKAVMGIVKASRCVRTDELASVGFFGGGGKREPVATGAPECCGMGFGGKLAPGTERDDKACR
jgi:hypothetical protein